MQVSFTVFDKEFVCVTHDIGRVIEVADLQTVHMFNKPLKAIVRQLGFICPVSLIAALSDEERVDAEIEAFLSAVDYTALKRTQEFIDVKELLKQIMELVAQELSSNWDDPRYSRETADE